MVANVSGGLLRRVHYTELSTAHQILGGVTLTGVKVQTVRWLDTGS